MARGDSGKNATNVDKFHLKVLAMRKFTQQMHNDGAWIEL